MAKVVLSLRFEHGKPLVTPEELMGLPTMMRQLHEWYMNACKDGTNNIYVDIKNEHFYNGREMLYIEFEEIFQLYQQRDLDKTIIASYCLLKIIECRERQIYDVGFINPNYVFEKNIVDNPKETESIVLQALLGQSTRRQILFPYNFKNHFILLEIQLEEGIVTVLDSMRKDSQETMSVQRLLQRVWKQFTKQVKGVEWKKELKFVHPKCLLQLPGTNLCGYYVCEFIRHSTSERGRGITQQQLDIWAKRDELLPNERVRAISEELAGFFLDHVIPQNGEFHREFTADSRRM